MGASVIVGKWAMLMCLLLLTISGFCFAVQHPPNVGPSASAAVVQDHHPLDAASGHISLGDIIQQRKKRDQEPGAEAGEKQQLQPAAGNTGAEDGMPEMVGMGRNAPAGKDPVQTGAGEPEVEGPNPPADGGNVNQPAGDADEEDGMPEMVGMGRASGEGAPETGNVPPVQTGRGEPKVEGPNPPAGGNVNPPVEEHGANEPDKPGEDLSFDQKMHKDTFVQTDGKRCYVGKSGAEAWAKKRDKKPEDVMNGKIMVHDPDKRKMCLGIYNELAAERTCGTGFYEPTAFCIKVNFFGQKGIDQLRASGLMNKPETSPKTIEEHQKQYMQSLILAIMEGCMRCEAFDQKKVKKPSIILTLQRKEEKGPFPTFCPEKYVNMTTLGEEMFYYELSTVFMVNAIMSERLCATRSSLSMEPKIAPIRYAQAFRLQIEHNCHSDGNEALTTYFLESAKEIEIDKLNDHVFELRELEFSLDDKTGTDKIDWDWETPATGIGYKYFRGTVVEGGQQPVPVDVKTTTGGAKVVTEKPPDDVTTAKVVTEKKEVIETTTEVVTEKKDVIDAATDVVTEKKEAVTKTASEVVTEKKDVTETTKEVVTKTASEAVTETTTTTDAALENETTSTINMKTAFPAVHDGIPTVKKNSPVSDVTPDSRMEEFTTEDGKSTAPTATILAIVSASTEPSTIVEPESNTSSTIMATTPESTTALSTTVITTTTTVPPTSTIVTSTAPSTIATTVPPPCEAVKAKMVAPGEVPGWVQQDISAKYVELNSTKMKEAVVSGSEIRIRGIVDKEAKFVQFNLLHDAPEWHLFVGATLFRMEVNFEVYEKRGSIFVGSYHDANWTMSYVWKDAQKLLKRGEPFELYLRILQNTEEEPKDDKNSTAVGKVTQKPGVEEKPLETENREETDAKGKKMHTDEKRIAVLVYLNGHCLGLYRGDLPLWSFNWLQVNGDVKLTADPQIFYAEEPALLWKYELARPFYDNDSICFSFELLGLNLIIDLLHEANEFSRKLGDVVIRFKFKHLRENDPKTNKTVYPYIFTASNFLHATQRWEKYAEFNSTKFGAYAIYNVSIVATNKGYSFKIFDKENGFIKYDMNKKNPVWMVNWISIFGDVQWVKWAEKSSACGEYGLKTALPPNIRLLFPDQLLAPGDQILVGGTVAHNENETLSFALLREALKADSEFGNIVFHMAYELGQLTILAKGQIDFEDEQTFQLDHQPQVGEEFWLKVLVDADENGLLTLGITYGKEQQRPLRYKPPGYPFWAIQYVKVEGVGQTEENVPLIDVIRGNKKPRPPQCEAVKAEKIALRQVPGWVQQDISAELSDHIISTKYVELNSTKMKEAVVSGSEVRIRGIVDKEAKFVQFNLLHNAPEWHQFLGATPFRMEVNFEEYEKSGSIFVGFYHHLKWRMSYVWKDAQKLLKRGEPFELYLRILQNTEEEEEPEPEDDDKSESDDSTSTDVSKVTQNPGAEEENTKRIAVLVYLNGHCLGLYRGDLPLWSFNWLQVNGDVKQTADPEIFYAEEPDKVWKYELARPLYINDSICFSFAQDLTARRDFLIIDLLHQANEFSRKFGDVVIRFKRAFIPRRDLAPELREMRDKKFYNFTASRFLHKTQSWENYAEFKSTMFDANAIDQYNVSIVATETGYSFKMFDKEVGFIEYNQDRNNWVSMVNWVSISGTLEYVKWAEESSACGQYGLKITSPPNIRLLFPDQLLAPGDQIVVRGTVTNSTNLSFFLLREALEGSVEFGNIVFVLLYEEGNLRILAMKPNDNWGEEIVKQLDHQPLVGEEFELNVVVDADEEGILTMKVTYLKDEPSVLYRSLGYPFWAIQYIKMEGVDQKGNVPLIDVIRGNKKKLKGGE